MVITPGDVFRVPLMWLMQDSHIDLYIVKKTLVAWKPEKEESKKNKVKISIEESGISRNQNEKLLKRN